MKYTITHTQNRVILNMTQTSSTQLNFSHEFNLNKEAILLASKDRANRTNKTVLVYVAPPIPGTKQNRWFGRTLEEGKPANSVKFCEIRPTVSAVVPFSQN